MPRFRVEYTKFHVQAIIKPKREELSVSEITAVKYFPEGKIWFIASDLVRLMSRIVRESSGYFLKVVVQPLNTEVKFLLRDRFHGIFFRNFLKRDEELIIYVKLWKFSSKPRRVRKGPRQIFKLLNGIEKFSLSYYDPHVQVYYSRYLPYHICREETERELNLTLVIKDVELVLEKTRCDIPVIPLRKGDSHLLFVLQSLAEIRQIYQHLGKRVTLARIDGLRHGVSLVIIR